MTLELLDAFQEGNGRNVYRISEGKLKGGDMKASA
jgi:hypothetical protein